MARIPLRLGHKLCLSWQVLTGRWRKRNQSGALFCPGPSRLCTPCTPDCGPPVQLSIHEWDRAIDGDPAGYYGQYDSVNLLTVLPPFGAVDLSPYKLMIRTRNVVPPPSLPPQQRQQQDWMGSRLVVQVRAG